MGCPPASDWGLFDSGESSATVFTDDQGIAVSPAYFAGATPSVGNTIIVWPVSGQPPFNFPFSEALAARKLIEFTQLGTAAAPVPALSLPNMLVLILLVLVAAYMSRKVLGNAYKP